MPSRHFLKKCSQPWGPHLMSIGAFAKCRLTFVMTVLQFTETSDPIQLLVLLSRVLTLQSHARQASLSFTISQSLLKLVSIESVMPSKHLILYHPLFLPPSIFPSIKVFSNESPLCIRWPKYWSFSFRVSPSNEYSEFISFRIDGMDLLAVQGTLKGLPQHHILKASVFQCSAFFMV